MENFSINTVKSDNAVIISLVGMADMLIVDELDKAFNEIIEQEQGVNIVVDLAELNFICSVALSSLIRAHRKCKNNDNRLVLASVPIVIQRLLATTQLDSLFKVYDCPESACKDTQ